MYLFVSSPNLNFKNGVTLDLNYDRIETFSMLMSPIGLEKLRSAPASQEMSCCNASISPGTNQWVDVSFINVETSPILFVQDAVIHIALQIC